MRKSSISATVEFFHLTSPLCLRFLEFVFVFLVHLLGDIDLLFEFLTIGTRFLMLLTVSQSFEYMLIVVLAVGGRRESFFVI